MRNGSSLKASIFGRVAIKQLSLVLPGVCLAALLWEGEYARWRSFIRFYLWRFGVRVRDLIAAAHISRETRREKAFLRLIGNTPLVKLISLSDELGVEVYGKAEFLNPGGSVKDRVAKSILQHCPLAAGDCIVEGTSGSTGISLALAANCYGLKTVIFLPNDQAAEKTKTLRSLGATVAEMPPSLIIDPDHYVNAARAYAEERETKERRFFCDQFENEANFSVHYRETGPEILKQLRGCINGFVASCGTGGTMSGVARCLKEYDVKIRTVLADPQGSALATKVQTGVLYNARDAEGHRHRRVHDTIVEGVGINRVTRNLELGLPYIDYALSVTDCEVVHMSRYLLAREGLFLGSSSALNCCAIVKAVRSGLFSAGDRIVTILCDAGVRHVSRLFNAEYLRSKRLLPRYIDPDPNLQQLSSITHNATPSLMALNSIEWPSSVKDFIDP